MKLVTFDEGRVGRHRRRHRHRTRRALDARVLRARRRRSPRPASVCRSPTCGCARRSCRRSSSTPPATSPTTTRSSGRRLVAPGAQGHRVLPERRRDHRPGRRDRVPRGPHQGARLRARARDHHRQVRASSSGLTRPRTTSPASWSSTTSPRATSSAGRWSPASSRSPRRSTRSARSARGSSPPTRSPDPHDAGDGAARQRRGAPDRATPRSCCIKFPHLVAYHSPQGYSAGDIITTGTISGVAAVQPNPFDFYLQPGRPDRGRDRGRRHAAQPRRAVERCARHRAVHDRPLLADDLTARR